MKYIDIRSQIRSGDILAFSQGGAEGWKTLPGIQTNIVRLMSETDFSHVGACWVIGERVLAFEAVKPKLRLFPLSKLGDFYWLPMSAPWKDETLTFALSALGTEYSNLACIKAYLNTLEDGNVQECAAYVREIMKHDGIDLQCRATPADVVHAAMRRGADLKFVSNQES